MKAADEGEEGRPTHPSTMAGRDLCGGSPGAAQVSVLVCLGALFLTPWLRAGSQLPGGGCKRGGPQPSLAPSFGDAGLSLGALALVPMPGEAQTPCLCCSPQTCQNPQDPWLGEMENHGRKLALARSLRGSSRRPWGKASLPACPPPNHGAGPPTAGVPPCPAKGDSPHGPRGGWKRSRHFLCRPLWAVTIASKIWSHM